MRYPAGTPYAGPNVSYDHLISPAQNLARAAYGLPRPLLAPGQRMDSPFFGRLYAELANAHAVLVKVCACAKTARNFATKLRPELPADMYEVGVKQDDDDPRPDVWLVIAYNRINKSLVRPAWMQESPPHADEQIPMSEAAFMLGVKPRQARRLIDQYGIEYRIHGGRRERTIRRGALVVLANRPRRWKRRRASTA